MSICVVLSVVLVVVVVVIMVICMFGKLKGNICVAIVVVIEHQSIGSQRRCRRIGINNSSQLG